MLGDSMAASPGADSPIAWHTDPAQAWQASVAQQRPLLVFVTREKCAFCVKMNRSTWRDSRVAMAIRAGYVPLFVDATTPTPLAKELAVTAYPTTFVISPQAVVLERITGYVAPEALAQRLSRPAATAAAAGSVARSR